MNRKTKNEILLELLLQVAEELSYGRTIRRALSPKIHTQIKWGGAAVRFAAFNKAAEELGISYRELIELIGKRLPPDF